MMSGIDSMKNTFVKKIKALEERVEEEKDVLRNQVIKLQQELHTATLNLDEANKLIISSSKTIEEALKKPDYER